MRNIIGIKVQMFNARWCRLLSVLTASNSIWLWLRFLYAVRIMLEVRVREKNNEKVFPKDVRF